MVLQPTLTLNILVWTVTHGQGGKMQPISQVQLHPDVKYRIERHVTGLCTGFCSIVYKIYNDTFAHRIREKVMLKIEDDSKERFKITHDKTRKMSPGSSLKGYHSKTIVLMRKIILIWQDVWEIFTHTHSPIDIQSEYTRLLISRYHIYILPLLRIILRCFWQTESSTFWTVIQQIGDAVVPVM